MSDDQPSTTSKTGHSVPGPPTAVPGGWLARMRAGLARSSKRLAEGIAGIFTRRQFDPQSLEDLEDLLLSADLGPTNATRLTAFVAERQSGNKASSEISPTTIRQVLAEEIARIVAPSAQSLSITARPFVILVLGVNGCGKTTTIGKLAKFFRDQRYSVLAIAGDTFRAAAIEQLIIWTERARCSIFARERGADAAGVVFEGCQQALREQHDIVLIDTGGRLHNRSDLMAQLQKMIRALKKLNPDFPHATLLVLDAGTGQNALSQVEVFSALTADSGGSPGAAGASSSGLTGLILTKLDGTAKGGILLALVERFSLPVYALGVGEAIDDLRPFEPHHFAQSLMSLE